MCTWQGEDSNSTCVKWWRLATGHSGCRVGLGKPWAWSGLKQWSWGSLPGLEMWPRYLISSCSWYLNARQQKACAHLLACSLSLTMPGSCLLHFTTSLDRYKPWITSSYMNLFIGTALNRNQKHYHSHKSAGVLAAMTVFTPDLSVSPAGWYPGPWLFTRTNDFHQGFLIPGPSRQRAICSLSLPSYARRNFINAGSGDRSPKSSLAN